jgi:hypothetical protein
MERAEHAIAVREQLASMRIDERRKVRLTQQQCPRS